MNKIEWNLHAAEFEELVCDITREGITDEIERLVREARKLLKPRNRTLIDLGCGIGTFIGKYGRHFSKIIGVEHSTTIIARAKANCANVPGVVWCTRDAGWCAPFIKDRADLTVCMNVITSHDATERNAQWASLSRLTKRSGLALVVVPSLESEQMVGCYDRHSKRPTANGLVERDGAFQKHYSRRELVATAHKHGFVVKRTRRLYYPWSIEGLRKPSAAHYPWDWACLAQRTGRQA